MCGDKLPLFIQRWTSDRLLSSLKNVLQLGKITIYTTSSFDKLILSKIHLMGYYHNLEFFSTPKIHKTQQIARSSLNYINSFPFPKRISPQLIPNLAVTFPVHPYSRHQRATHIQDWKIWILLKMILKISL